MDPVKYAEKALNENSKEYPLQSQLMCWTAVINCKVQNVNKFGSGAGAAGSALEAKAKGFVTKNDPQVRGVEDMKAVKAGHVLGFFDNDGITHCMICLGVGFAAGNKNDCVGLGHAVGWEKLDLRKLNWNGNNISAPGKLSKVPRTVEIHHRPLSEF